jgi:hypothetical protein
VTSVISAERLGEAVGLGRLADHDITAILGSMFPLSRWVDGGRVSYFQPEQGHVLDLVYAKSGTISSCEPGEGLTTELVQHLRERAELELDSGTGFEVWRDVLFSAPEVKGFWRHSDDWQILPAPANAPRPGFSMGEHPFVLEYRVRKADDFRIRQNRRLRRLWELHLLLSLLVRYPITRESLERPHHWVLLPDFAPAYANEGYMVGEGFTAVADDLSDSGDLPSLRVVADDEYYGRLGIGPDETEIDVPACFDGFFDSFEVAPPERRDKVLRASYWFDAAYRVWHISKSLSFISAINAIESLFPPRGGGGHVCPVCKSHDDPPGPSALFRSFVETYAEAEGAESRNAMYTLRSTFVHGGALHGLDLPRSWGSLEPTTETHRDLHATALSVARTTIRTWFLQKEDETTPAGS